MRQLRPLLRLRLDGVSAREIGRRLGVARSTIQDNLKRTAAAGLAWPLADDVTDEALEHRLFGRAGAPTGQRRRVEPDWAALARELKRPGVTMMILWEEYREVHPEGYGYSRFCDLLRGFERRLTPVMRQHHEAGEKAFVDYSGKRIGIADPATGEIHEAEIFVGVLGASNLTYAEATWTQQLPDWTGAHVRMFRFFGGAPKLLVPDNLKSGVHKASFYDPEINRTYSAMATHYSVGILPARPGRPRDKAKVEAGVPFAQTYILGRLRQLTFFSLAQCNEAIAKLRHPASVEDVNYQSPRGLDRALFLKLAACDWIAERRNLLVTGASGLGKSWLACALGHKACRENMSVLYTRMPRLFADLAIAHGDTRYAKLLRSLARVKLLILDDWGPEALTADQARDLLEIVEDRYDKGSLIITSQVPVDRWHDLIGVPTLADAILDRVIHNAYRIELAGESLRKRRSSP
jgi:transposase